MNRARLRVELRTRPRREEHLEALLDTAVAKVRALTETIAELRYALAESESRQAHAVAAIQDAWCMTQRALGRGVDRG